MRAAAEAAWGAADASTAAQWASPGVGKVGRHLVGHLVEDGARWSSPTCTSRRSRAVQEEYADVTAVADTPALIAADLDVYAPCAMGGALTDDVVDALTARIVCGAANNQLAHPGVEKRLIDRGILYAPDYCVNSGGLIQVADELEGFSFERAQQRAASIYETTLAVFERAEAEGVSPARGGGPAG